MALVEDLYNKLTEGGYYTKSLGEFEAQLEDPTYRKKVHGVVTRDGIEDTDFETFDVKYTPLKKKEESALPSMESETSGSLATPEMATPEPMASSSTQREVTTTTSQEPAMAVPDILKQFEEQTGKKVSTTVQDKKEEIVQPQKPLDQEGLQYFPEGTGLTNDPVYLNVDAKGEISGSDYVSSLLRSSSILKDIEKDPNLKYLMEKNIPTQLPEVQVTADKDLLFAKNVGKKKRKSFTDILVDIGKYGKKAAVNIYEDVLIPTFTEEEARQRRLEEKAQKLFDEQFRALDPNNPADKEEYNRVKTKNKWIDATAKAAEASIDVGGDAVIDILKKGLPDLGFEYETSLTGVVYVTLPNGRKLTFDPDGSKVEKSIIKAFTTSVIENQEYYKTLNEISKTSMIYDQLKYQDLQKKLKEEEKKLKEYVSLRPGEYSYAVFGKSLSTKNLEQKSEYNRQKVMSDSIDLDNEVKKYKEQENALKQAYNEGRIDYQTYEGTLNGEEYKAVRQSIVNKAQDLQNLQDEISEDDAYMQDLYTEYQLVQQERGSASAYIGANFMKGFVDIFGGIMALSGEDIGEITVSDWADSMGLVVTDEYTKNPDMPDWEYALGSLANTAPGLLFDFFTTGGSGSVGKLTLGQVAKNLTFLNVAKYVGQKALLKNPSDVAIALLSYKQYEDQFNANPETRDIPEAEKVLIGLLMAYTTAKLESVGMSKWMPKNLKGGIATSILRSVISSVGKGASKEVVEAAIDRNIATLVAKGAINVAKAGTAEYGTEALQTANEEGIKELYDTIKDSNYFEDKTLWQVASDMNEAGRIGLIGGGIMGGITNSLNTAGLVRDNLQTKQIIKVLEDPDLKDIYKRYLTNQYKSGEMSKEEVTFLTAKLKMAEDYFASIPDNIEDKTKAFELITEKDEITRSIANKDEALIVGQKERIEQINNELKEISKNATKKSTEQQQEGTADGGVVQREGTDQGQPQAGQGEGPVGETTQQETNISDSTVEGGGIQETEVVAQKDDIEKRRQEELLDAGVADIEKESIEYKALNELESLFEKHKEEVEDYVNESKKTGNEIDDRAYARIANKYWEELSEDVKNYLEFEAPATDFETPEGYNPNYKGFGYGRNEDIGHTEEVHGSHITTLRENVYQENANKVDKQNLAEDINAKYDAELADLESKVSQPIVEEEVVIDKPTITTNTTQELERVKVAAPEAEDGSTFNLDGTVYDGVGLVVPVVSVNTTVEEATPEMIADFVEQNADKIGDNETVKVGIYKFPNSNEMSIDLSVVAPEASRDQAIEFGKLADQESLYDLGQMQNVKTGGTGKNPMQFTGPQFKEIAKALKEGRLPNVFEQDVTLSQSSTGTVISGTDVEIDTQASKISKPRMTKIVSNAAKSLSRIMPDVKFVVHDTKQSFANVTGDTEASGYYIPGEVHINLENANARTVAHEVFHAVLLNAVKTDANAATTTRKMIEAIAPKIENNPELKNYLDDFASNYDENIQDEEKVSELVGVLAENYERSPETIKEKIKRWLDNIAKTFGLNPFNRNEVYDVLNTVARKVATGKKIKQKDVKIFKGGKNVKTPSDGLTSRFSYGNNKVKLEVTYIEQDKMDDLIKKGLVKEVKDLSELNGSMTVTTSPDDMFVGSISVNGKKVAEGNGGVYFVTKFGDVWANSDKKTATMLKNAINESFEKNGGKAYVSLVKGTDAKLISSPQGVTSSLAVTESMLDAGLFSLSDFRSAVRSAVKSAGGDIKLSPNGSAKQLKEEIDNFFKDVNSSTFEKRGNVLRAIIANLAKSESAKNNKKEIIAFLDGDKNKGLGVGVTPNSQSLVDLIAKVSAEKLTKGLNTGDIYAVIEIDGKVDVFQDEHQSYPYHIKIVDDNGKVSKTKPVLILPQNRKNGREILTSVDGKTAEEMGSSFAGSVGSTANLPLGKGIIQDGKSKTIEGEQTITPRQQKVSQQVPGNRLFSEPLKQATTIADRYAQNNGIEMQEIIPVKSLDETVSKEIAKEYDKMKNDPTNPEVAKAYKAMAEETLAQYEEIIKDGFFVEINNEEPYANSSSMIEDLRKNKRMKIFSTESGFGDTPITDQQRKENPLLKDSGFKDVNGNTLLVNDVFRFVHDFFGHAKEGNSFGPIGEENAWLIHSAMYSPLARRAMTSETRGQNSWVNFSGVNEEAFKLRDKARKLRSEGKVKEANQLTEEVYNMMQFADQKIGLMPEWTAETPAEVTPRKQKRIKTLEAVEAGEKYIEDRRKRTTRKNKWREYVQKWEDRQSDAKRAINGINSLYSRRALNLMVNRAGASGWANERFKEADDKIYKGLSRSMKKYLNGIIYARRIIAINEYRAKNNMKPYTGWDGTTYKDAQEDMIQYKKELGDKKFNKLEKRADEYFKVYNENLRLSYESGRINKATYERFMNTEYSPIKTLKYIIGEDVQSQDDLDRQARLLGITSDEINSLKDENNNEFLSDTRWLLMMSIAASSRKNFENKLLNAINDAVENATESEKEMLSDIFIDNPVVGKRKDGSLIYKYDRSKVPDTHRKIVFFKDGSKRSLIVRKKYADQILDLNNVPDVLKKIGKYTGATIIRFFATSGNPLFILGNVASDFSNILFLSDVYGKIKPVGAVHLAFDFVKNFLRTNATSAAKGIRKTGIGKRIISEKIVSKLDEIRKDYIEHGGGMDYMTADGVRNLQSRISKYPILSVPQKMLVSYGKLLSYLGEKSEEAFRLSVYEKTKNDLIKKWQEENSTKDMPTGQELEDIKYEAVREAREVIDFNQGGQYAKNVDAFLPYFNAGLQGTRRMREYAVKNPRSFASSMVQGAVMGGIVMAGSLSYLMSAACEDAEDEADCNKKMMDALNSLSEYEKSNYHIIFTGKKDEKGEYEYVRIKKLPGLSMVTTLAEQLFTKFFFGMRGVDYDISGKVLYNTVKSSIPFDPTDVVGRSPLVSALVAYAGWDLFKNELVFKKPRGWEDREIKSTVEGINDDNVNNFFKFLAPKMYMSPARTQAMVEKLITSENTNPTISLLYAVANGLTFQEGLKESWDTATNEFLKNVSRKLIRTTNKKLLDYVEQDKIRDMEIEENSKEYVNTTDMYDEIKDIYDKGGSLTNGQLLDMVIEKFGEAEAEAYFNKYNNYIRNRSLDKRLLNIVFERKPRLQALYLYERYGNSLEQEELNELNTIMSQTNSKISKEALYFYNENYSNKK